LGLERDREAHVFLRGTHLPHVENWPTAHAFIQAGLKLSGLQGRGRRNAFAIEVQRNDVAIPHLPPAFDGFTLLHLTDLHIDSSPEFAAAFGACVGGLHYDACVLTGDYRLRTFGPYEATLAGLERLRSSLSGAAYAVLGNHDSIRMVRAMEAMGYRTLLNEWTKVERDGEFVYLAGIDDAHYYRMENFHRAAHDIPERAASILLAHTPESYLHAAHAGFDLMLSGHTHGGQICLPGGFPIITEAKSPRRLARGARSYRDLAGYTSAGAGTCIVEARFNCSPEVTLHRLRRATRS
ncbi:MAG: metallophosphoesterase, partial [Alphaproteobacteria bacterium]|nr:metallophosphoesterase [Alphaproteobacteria bacterium]